MAEEKTYVPGSGSIGPLPMVNRKNGKAENITGTLESPRPGELPLGRRDYTQKIIKAAVVDDHDGSQAIVVRDQQTLAKVNKDYGDSNIPIYMDRNMDNTFPTIPKTKLTNGYDPRKLNDNELSDFTSKGVAYEKRSRDEYTDKLQKIGKAVSDGRLTAEQAQSEETFINQTYLKQLNEGPRAPAKIKQLFQNGEISLQYANQALRDQGFSVDELIPERAKIPSGRGENGRDMAIADYMKDVKDPADLDSLVEKSKEALMKAQETYNAAVDVNDYISDFATAKAMQKSVNDVATKLSEQKGISFDEARKLALKDRTGLEVTKDAFLGVVQSIATLAPDFIQMMTLMPALAVKNAVTGGDEQLQVQPGTETSIIQKAYNAVERFNKSVEEKLKDPRVLAGLDRQGVVTETLEQIPGAFASTASYFAAAGLGRGIVKAIGMGVRAQEIGAIVGGTALVGAPAQMSDAYKFAKSMGQTDEEAFSAVMLGAGISLSEYLPFAKYFDGMSAGTAKLARRAFVSKVLDGVPGEFAIRQGLKPVGEAIAKTIERIPQGVKAFTKQAVEEGGQEFGQQTFQEFTNYYNALKYIDRDLNSPNPEIRKQASERLNALDAGHEDWLKTATQAGVAGFVSGGFVEAGMRLTNNYARSIRINGINAEREKIYRENADILNSGIHKGYPQVSETATAEQARATRDLHLEKRTQSIGKIVGEPVSKQQAEDVDILGSSESSQNESAISGLEKQEKELLAKAEEAKQRMARGTNEEVDKASQDFELYTTMAQAALEARVGALKGIADSIKRRYAVAKEIETLAADPKTEPFSRILRIALKVAGNRQDLLTALDRQDALRAKVGNSSIPFFTQTANGLTITQEGLARFEQLAPNIAKFLPRSGRPATQQQAQQATQQPKPEVPPAERDKNGNLKNGADKTVPPATRNITQPPAKITPSPLTTAQAQMARKVEKSLKALFVEITLQPDTVRRLAEAIVRKNPGLQTSQITTAIKQFLDANGINQAPTGTTDRAEVVRQYVASGYTPEEAEKEADYYLGGVQESKNKIEQAINAAIEKVESEDQAPPGPAAAPRVPLRQLNPHEARKFSAIAQTLKAVLGYEVSDDIINRLSEIIAKRSRNLGISPIQAVEAFLRRYKIPQVSSVPPENPKARANYDAIINNAAIKLASIVSALEAEQVSHPSEQGDSPEVERVRDLVESLAQVYAGALQRTGFIVVEVSEDEDIGQTGFLVRPRLKQIQFSASVLTKGNQTDEQIRLRMLEEVIHAVAIKLGLPSQLIAKQLREKIVDGRPLAEVVAALYASRERGTEFGYDKKQYEEILNNEFMLSHEYIRMLVQFALEGKTTEIEKYGITAAKTWLQAILDFLKQYLFEIPNDPVVRRFVDAISLTIKSLPAYAEIGVQGARGYVETPDRALFGETPRIGVRYVIIDAGEAKINQSINSSQNRDRTSRVSREQIESIKRDLNPGRVTEGAIIYPDGFERGNPMTTEGAPVVDSSLNILAGNARMTAILELILEKSNRYQEYKSYITNPKFANDYGFTEAQMQAIQKMESPVLVRVLEREFEATPEGQDEQSRFVRSSNVASTAALSPIEQAISDARALVPGPDEQDPMLQLSLSEGKGIFDLDFIKYFLRKVVSPSERPLMFNPDGSFSQALMNRMETAVLARAYSPQDFTDRAILTALSDLVTGTWEGNQKVKNALLAMAQPISIYRAAQEAGQKYPLDISQDILAAVRLVSSFKADASAPNAPKEITRGPMGQRAELWARSLLGFAQASEIGQALFYRFVEAGNKAVTEKTILRPLLAYYTLADQQGSPAIDNEIQNGLFKDGNLANEPTKTKLEIFRISIETVQRQIEQEEAQKVVKEVFQETEKGDTLKSQPLANQASQIASITRRMLALREVRDSKGQLSARQQQEYEFLERALGQQFMFEEEYLGIAPARPVEQPAPPKADIGEKYIQGDLFSARLRDDENTPFLPFFPQVGGQGVAGQGETAQGNIAGEPGRTGPVEGATGTGGSGSAVVGRAGGQGYGGSVQQGEGISGPNIQQPYTGATEPSAGGTRESGSGVEGGYPSNAGGQPRATTGVGGGTGRGVGTDIGGGVGAVQIPGGEVRGGGTGQAGGVAPAEATDATRGYGTGAGSQIAGGTAGTTPTAGGRGEIAGQPTATRQGLARGAFEYSVDNGTLQKRDANGAVIQSNFTQDQTQAAQRYVNVREALKALFSAEIAGNEELASVARSRLSTAYGEFVRIYGTLNKPNDSFYAGNKAIQFLADDPDFYSVLSIESPVRASQGALFTDMAAQRSITWERGGIFEKSVITPNTPPQKSVDARDAINNSIQWNGGFITPEYVSKQTGLAIPQAREALASDQSIVEEIDPETAKPNGRFVPVGHFVSGNVRSKLSTAQRALDNGQQVQRQVAILRAAVPPEQKIGKIYAGPGARWIPNELRSRFISEVLGFEGSAYLADKWYIEERLEASNTGDFAIHGLTAAKMFGHLLNGTLPKVRVRNPITGVTRVDTRRTQQAIEVLRNLQNRWRTWIRSGAQGRQIETIFNEKINAYAEPLYQFQTALPGLSTDIRKDPHQTSVVARNVMNKSSYISHMVGAGKTYSMIMSAMELKRLGLAKKPLIVAYGPTLGQVVASAKKAYPTSRLLVATKSSFSPKNRQRFLEAAASQDYDIIIITQDNYDMLVPGEDSIRAYYREQRRIYGNRRSSIPPGERAESNLDRKMDKLSQREQEAIANAGKTPSHMKFDNLGVDAIFIDEAHGYKGIPINTTRAGKGLPTAYSAKGFKSMLKTNHIHSLGGRVYMASGTPIVNSVAEAYGTIQLTNPSLLREIGIETFDDFVSTFIQPDYTLNYTWKGTFEFEERYEKFYNEIQLSRLVRQALDIKLNPAELGLNLPLVKGGVPKIVAVDRTPSTDAINRTLLRVAGKWDEMARDIETGQYEEDKYVLGGEPITPSALRRMLGWIPIVSMQLGSAASLDPRLVDPMLADSPTSKLNTAIGQIKDIYQKNPDGSIIVFMDRYKPIRSDTLGRMMAFADGRWDDAVPRDIEDSDEGQNNDEIDRENEEDDIEQEPSTEFNLAREAIKKLAAAGVPENEIAWINDAKDREDLFRKVREGDIRVIIGSTSRLGQGVDIAQKLVAMVELDPPLQMVPSASTQRRGRIVRQSNLNKEVELFRMGLKDSMDVSIYQMLERKEKSSIQFLSGGMSNAAGTPDPLAQDSPDTLFGYMRAALIGDPRVIELVEATRTARELRNGYETHEEQRLSAARRSAELQSSLVFASERLKYQVDIAKFLKTSPFATEKNGVRKFNFTHQIGGPEILIKDAGGDAKITQLSEPIKGREELTAAIGRTMAASQEKLKRMSTQQQEQSNFQDKVEYVINKRFALTITTTIGADGVTITGTKFTLSSYYPTEDGTVKKADLRSGQITHPGDVQARILMWATDFPEVVQATKSEIKNLNDQLESDTASKDFEYPLIRELEKAENKLSDLQQDLVENPPERILRSQAIAPEGEFVPFKMETRLGSAQGLPSDKREFVKYYSALELALQKLPEQVTINQLKQVAYGAGVKTEEARWSGLLDFIEFVEKSGQTQIQQYNDLTIPMSGMPRLAPRIPENKVFNKAELSEFLVSNVRDLLSFYKEKADFSSYTTGASLEEKRLKDETLPPWKGTYSNKNYEIKVFGARIPARYRAFLLGTGEARALHPVLEGFPAMLDKLHFNQYNAPGITFPAYVGHVRTDRLQDENGVTGTIIEELQQDSRRDTPFGTWKTEIPREYVEVKNATTLRKAGSAYLAMFKHELGLAAERGDKWIGLTTGEAQMDRYNLQKVVDEIRVIPYKQPRGSEYDAKGNFLGFKESRLYYIIGSKEKREVLEIRDANEDKLRQTLPKFIADAAINAKEASFDPQTQALEKLPADYPGVLTFKGEDLRMGNSGLGRLYNEIIPDYINKYVKKWGAKLKKGLAKVPDITMTKIGGKTVIPPTREERMQTSYTIGGALFGLKQNQVAEEMAQALDNKIASELIGEYGEYLEALDKSAYNLYSLIKNIRETRPPASTRSRSGEEDQDFSSADGSTDIAFLKRLEKDMHLTEKIRTLIANIKYIPLFFSSRPDLAGKNTSSYSILSSESYQRQELKRALFLLGQDAESFNRIVRNSRLAEWATAILDYRQKDIADVRALIDSQYKTLDNLISKFSSFNANGQVDGLELLNKNNFETLFEIVRLLSTSTGGEISKSAWQKNRELTEKGADWTIDKTKPKNISAFRNSILNFDNKEVTFYLTGIGGAHASFIYKPFPEYKSRIGEAAWLGPTAGELKEQRLNAALKWLDNYYHFTERSEQERLAGQKGKQGGGTIDDLVDSAVPADYMTRYHNADAEITGKFSIEKFRSAIEKLQQKGVPGIKMSTQIYPFIEYQFYTGSDPESVSQIQRAAMQAITKWTATGETEAQEADSPRFSFQEFANLTGGTLETETLKTPTTDIWRLDITPEMAEDIKKGQALFSQRIANQMDIEDGNFARFTSASLIKDARATLTEFRERNQGIQEQGNVVPPQYPIGSVPTELKTTEDGFPVSIEKESQFKEFLAKSNSTKSQNFINWFGNSKVLEADNSPAVVYHGTRRADRIGTRFMRSRATSGPMAYFTQNIRLASAYSFNKADTSITNNDYENWFLIDINGQKMPFTKAWNYLTTQERQRISENAKRIAMDDDGNLVMLDEGHISGPGNYDYEIKQARGNAFEALMHSWLWSANLFGSEHEKFPQVLKMAGLTRKIHLDGTDIRLPAVYPVYLKIENPLDTRNVPQNVIDYLTREANRRRTNGTPPQGMGDNWMKSEGNPKIWITKFLEGIEKLKTDPTYSPGAWTSIPEWVTDSLKRLGYDGIKDVSGKNDPDPNALKEDVWIPFYPNQIKSVFNFGNFGPGADILKSQPIENQYDGPTPESFTPFYTQDVQYDPMLDQNQINAEATGILGTEAQQARKAVISTKEIQELKKRRIKPTSRTFVSTIMDLLGGKLDRLDYYAPGTASALIEEKRNMALAQAAMTDLMDYLKRKAVAVFGYPGWWNGFKNYSRMRKAIAELLPVASRLEIERMSEDGPVWRAFNQPAGVISQEEMIRNGLMAGRTFSAKNGETLLIGPVFTDKYGKETGYNKLYRPMSQQRQQEIYDSYLTKYPEMMPLLMDWIMPGKQKERLTYRGVEVPVFNRYSLHDFYTTSPFGEASSVHGYTPDVPASSMAIASIIARIPFLGKAIINQPMGGGIKFRPFLSGGRFPQTGVLREAGMVKDLFNGFSVRAMEIFRERIRAKVRARLIEAAVTPSSEVDPEIMASDYIHIGAVLRQMALAAAKMRANVSDINNLDPNQPSLFNQEKYTKYVSQLVEEGQKFLDQDYVIRKEVAAELLHSLAEEKTEGDFVRFILGAFKRLNAGYLAMPRTAFVNIVTNELLKGMYALNRFVYGAFVGPLMPGITARETRIARREAIYAAREFFGIMGFPGFARKTMQNALRPFGINIKDKASHYEMKKQMIPLEIFGDTTMVAALQLDKDKTWLDEVGSLNLGGAALKFMRYQDIDATQKVHLAYASYQAHAEQAWIDAIKDNPDLKNQDKNTWKINWAKEQGREFHEMVYKTAVTYLFDYQNVPFWLDSEKGGVVGKILQASVYPFFKFFYNLVRQAGRFTFGAAYKANALNAPFAMAGFVANIMGQKEAAKRFSGIGKSASTPQERADAISSLILMTVMVILGASLGFDDDEEPIIGSDVDAEGKPKDAAQRTGGRLNLDRLMRSVLAFFRLKGTPLYEKFDTDEDAYVRLRNYPYFREAMMIGNVMRILNLRSQVSSSLEDKQIENPEVTDLDALSKQQKVALLMRREAELSQELSSMVTDYATLGVAAKLIVGTMYGMTSPYDIGKTTSWKVGETSLDLLTSGVMPVSWRGFARDLADPVARRNKPSAALEYKGGLMDSLKANIPFLSRSLPAQGNVKQRVYDPLNTEQAVDMARLDELGLGGSVNTFVDEKGKVRIAYPDPLAVYKQETPYTILRGITGFNVKKVKREKKDSE